MSYRNLKVNLNITRVNSNRNNMILAMITMKTTTNRDFAPMLQRGYRCGVANE